MQMPTTEIEMITQPRVINLEGNKTWLGKRKLNVLEKQDLEKEAKGFPPPQ